MITYRNTKRVISKQHRLNKIKNEKNRSMSFPFGDQNFALVGKNDRIHIFLQRTESD